MTYSMPLVYMGADQQGLLLYVRVCPGFQWYQQSSSLTYSVSEKGSFWRNMRGPRKPPESHSYLTRAHHSHPTVFLGKQDSLRRAGVGCLIQSNGHHWWTSTSHHGDSLSAFSQVWASQERCFRICNFLIFLLNCFLCKSNSNLLECRTAFITVYVTVV